MNPWHLWMAKHVTTGVVVMDVSYTCDFIVFCKDMSDGNLDNSQAAASAHVVVRFFKKSPVIAVVRKMPPVPVARPDSELGAAPVRGPNQLGDMVR